MDASAVRRCATGLVDLTALPEQEVEDMINGESRLAPILRRLIAEAEHPSEEPQSTFSSSITSSHR